MVSSTVVPLTVDDSGDYGLIDSVLRSDRSLCSVGRCQEPDLIHIGIGQLPMASTFRHHVSHVVVVRTEEKACWRTAWRRVAAMEHMQVTRIAVSDSPCDTMSCHDLAARETEASVAFGTTRAVVQPQTTSICGWRPYLREEALDVIERQNDRCSLARAHGGHISLCRGPGCLLSAGPASFHDRTDGSRWSR